MNHVPPVSPYNVVVELNHCTPEILFDAQSAYGIECPASALAGSTTIEIQAQQSRSDGITVGDPELLSKVAN